MCIPGLGQPLDLLANPTMSQLAWELVVDRCGELEGTVAAHGSLLAELLN